MYKPAHSYRNPTLARRSYRERTSYSYFMYMPQSQVTEVVRPANVDDEYDAGRDTYGRLWK